MITLAIMVVAGLIAGLFFNCFALAALAFGVVLAGVVSAASAGHWQYLLTLAVGVLLLQVGYVIALSVFAFPFSSKWSINPAPDARE